MNIFKNEFVGWKKLEVAWLLIACSVITGLSIYWGDTLMGIISATTGVACVVCTGKGKLSAYLFGLINCVLYALISYEAKYWGEVVLNVIYYIPMQFYGFYIWKNNMNKETHEVNKRHMTFKGRVLLLFSLCIVTIFGGFLLSLTNDPMPYVDAFTTGASIIAMIISIKMYSEQWWIWCAVNIFSIYLWYGDLMKDSDNFATLLMWCVYLLNAIIMLIKWEKEIKHNTSN